MRRSDESRQNKLVIADQSTIRGEETRHETERPSVQRWQERFRHAHPRAPTSIGPRPPSPRATPSKFPPAVAAALAAFFLWGAPAAEAQTEGASLGSWNYMATGLVARDGEVRVSPHHSIFRIAHTDADGTNRKTRVSNRAGTTIRLKSDEFNYVDVALGQLTDNIDGDSQSNVVGRALYTVTGFKMTGGVPRGTRVSVHPLSGGAPLPPPPPPMSAACRATQATDIWCATLEAVVEGSEVGYHPGIPLGSLAPTTFTHDGTTYTVTLVIVSGQQLSIGLSPGAGGRAWDGHGLALHVGDESLSFEDSTAQGGHRIWDVGHIWSSEQDFAGTHTVRIAAEPPAMPPSRPPSGGGGGGGTPPAPPAPPPDPVGYLENPTSQSFQSGIGVISGWVCEAEEVAIELTNGLTGEVETYAAAYGTIRTDTESECGDHDNGFGLLWNWNLLGDGQHTVRALVDGEELGVASVTVTTLGEEFARGLVGQYVVGDFPTEGEQVTLYWSEAQQNFVLGPAVLPEVNGTDWPGDLQVGFLGNPASHSPQSGIGVLSGWVCEAEEVEIELTNGVTGAVETHAAAYGTIRTDTAAICGDSDNGYGLLWNWNKLGDGVHTVRALVDGEELGRASVTVTTLGAEFVRGLRGRATLADFPTEGQAVVVEWQPAQQNFVITGRE